MFDHVILGILILLLSKVCFSLIVVIWKDLRKKGVDTFSNLSMFVFSIPILFVLGLFALQKHEVVLTWWYLLIVFLWIVPVFLSNIFDVYLLRYQSLTEQSSYKLAVATTLAFLADIFIFHATYSLWMLIAVSCFVIGGGTISRNKISGMSRLPLVRAFFFMTLIASADVIAYTLYKNGLLIQSTIFFHILISQSILFLLFFVVGSRKFIPHLRSRTISPKNIVSVNALIIIYVISEAIAVKELPLIIVVSASLLPLVLYSFFDFKNREVHLSKKSIFALILVLIGIVILGLT